MAGYFEGYSMTAPLTAGQTLALIGPAILVLFSFSFLYAWTFDRERRYLLSFALAFLFYCLGVLIQIMLWPGDLGHNAMLSAAVYGVASWLVAEAMLRRINKQLGWMLPVVVLAAMMIGIYYFFYISRDLVARIFIQNGLLGALFLATAMRMIPSRHARLSERILFWVFLAFALHFFVRLLLSMDVKDAVSTPEQFARSTFWIVLQISMSFFGVALGLALLASTVIDIMEGLRRERDIDLLTGVLARRSFEEKAAVRFVDRRREALSLIVCDIDHFKSLNDGYGHAVGDAVLRQLGDLLRHGVRAGDLVGRFGGEEFVILLRRAPLADAQQFAERLRQTIARTVFPELPAGRAVTASFGVAQRRPGEGMWDLFVRADTALYEAKSAGRDRVVADSAPAGPENEAVARQQVEA
jgi:diguanylate cyclase (GGDEF)-like protein